MKKISNIIIGSFLLGLGVVFANISGFGADPLSYFWYGISIRFNTSIGIANLIVTVVLLLVPLTMDRSQINIGTILSPAVISLTIDGLLPLAPVVHSPILKTGLLLLAVYTYTWGVAIYVYQNLGRSTYDGIIIILQEKMGWSRSVAKTGVDALMFVGAILMGANLRIGPFVFVLLSGTLIQRNTKHLNKRQEKA
ncbi:MAG TPA: hypothetical protein VFC75_02105 [Erysipelothrix sp.]|nr:hypothetical protein [Erysipelothrix sp.]